MRNQKPKKRIVRNVDNDTEFNKIKELIESEDPALDEPVICVFKDSYIYRTDFGAPVYGVGMPDYYTTNYITVGREARTSGSIPLTLRELKIAKTIGITDRNNRIA